MRNEVKFQCLYEELPFVALYLLVPLKRDKALFKAFSPLYTDEYIDALEAQKKLVEELVPSRQVTGEIKIITQQVASDYTRVRNMLNRLESYLKKAAAPLSMPASDFGIRQTRVELEAKNDEGIVKQLRVVQNNMDNNSAALEPVGYTKTISNELKALIISLTNNSTAQNIKIDDRRALTRENINEMNKLWKMMSDVLEDGKKIAKEKKNAAMVKDYTFKEIQKKVRQDRNTTGGTNEA